MASLENKIAKSGWSKRPYKEIRSKVKRAIALDDLPPRYQRVKRNNKLCKKNQMKPHEYGEPIPYKARWTEKILWKEKFCIHCHKKQYVFQLLKQ